MNTSNFYFEIDPGTALIDYLYTLNVGGITGYNLAQQMPGIFWIEQNINGDDCLCMSKTLGYDCPLTLSTTTVVYPKPFIAIPDQSNIFGPHPPVIFKPGPRK